MSKKRSKEKLFFGRTLDFLDHYLPEQALKSSNTIETYRDALTVFRRYIYRILSSCLSEHSVLKTAPMIFCWTSCITCVKGEMLRQPVITGLPPYGTICGMLPAVIFHCSQSR